MSRERVATARRVVVKVGSSSLTGRGARLDPARVDRFVEELCTLLDGRHEIVCVSSGAIAAGLAPLGLRRRPADMPTLQAAAAVGQLHLMDTYAGAFEARGGLCAQVLLTRQDFVHRGRYVNALHTFQRLLSLGVVPVVNENDTVATDEIRFGENDLLAALVANLVRADVLVLLSDVDGLHRRDGSLVGEVDEITDEVDRLARGSRSSVGSGGMRSKLAAARIATASGVPVVFARFRKGTLTRVLDGKTVGTLFAAHPSRLAPRKAWIAYATVPSGRVIVDDGARVALCEGNRSLLAAGVCGVDGSFAAGDAVDVVDASGRAFARGLVGFSSDELARIAGMGSSAIGELLGPAAAREVVHRDELVVL